ncbi:MAG: AraC family transcriptional regulator [Eubacteriales bacterium]
MSNTISTRIIVTPSSYAKSHYLYLQEIGTLTSLESHINKRDGLHSFLFIMVLTGTGYITQNKQRILLEAGDCAFLDCRQEYSHESSTFAPWTLKWIHYSGNYCEHFHMNFMKNNESFVFRPDDLTAYATLHETLYQLQEEKLQHTELFTHKYITDLLTIIITEHKSKTQTNVSLSRKLNQVRTYILEHYQEKITLESLSALFFISKYHLLREYKKAFGTTINTDLIAQRISQSKSYLRFSDYSVEEISELCGFSDVGYFIKVFKNMESVTPLSYRRQW